MNVKLTLKTKNGRTATVEIPTDCNDLMEFIKKEMDERVILTNIKIVKIEII